MITWDPLTDNNGDLDILMEAQKRQIKNILKSYVGIYDPFSELIQNAMDAVDQRAGKPENDNYQKHIYIEINLQQEYFSVTDNGIAFNEAQFKSFIAPNISYKDGSKNRGHKGVGSTYIAFGFNYLQMGTKSPEFEFIAEITDGRSWTEDTTKSVAKPQVRQSDLIHTAFNDIDRGSTFTIRFGGIKTRPKSLSQFNATTATQWLSILLIKTPLGNIDFFSQNSHKTTFDLVVIDKKGERTELLASQCDYIYPHSKIAASCDLKDILTAQSRMAEMGIPLTSLPPKFSRLNGLYEYYTPGELMSFFDKPKAQEDRYNLINEYNISAYGYFCYSTEVWDELNDSLLGLAKGGRILKGGLQLANNFMPQGELLVIPLTSNIGYQNQVHIVVHFKNADPDLGRKGFQPELKELSEEIAVKIVNKMKKWRHVLKIDTGEKPSLASGDTVFNWIQDQLKYEQANPLVIKNPNFFEPIKEISISSIPQSEQDVIVLFNQLVAGGVIRGIKLLATDQKRQYDGVFRFYVKEPIENHIYHRTENPLCVVKLEHRGDYSSRPLILEYKQNIDALIREFDNEEKKQNELNLVIAWEIGEAWKKSFTIISLLDLDNLHHREFHGLTHIMHSTHSKTYVIVLSELIEYLNETDVAQLLQKAKYSEPIGKDI